MKVLLLGSGGREHALAWKLAQSPRLSRLLVAPGNPGTARWGTNVPLQADSPEAVVSLARRERVDLVVVGPEAPLVAGVADALAQVDIPCFGPVAAAARIEGSKAFAKEVMAEAGVPTAAFRVFTDAAEAEAYAVAQGRIVVKADGLAAGKGVIVAPDAKAAREAVRAVAQMGQAGQRMVLEELLEGEEVSLMALCDGERYVLLPLSQDHKRVGEGDTGPNTGGMGAYCPAPFLTPAQLAQVGEQVIAPTLAVLKKRGTPLRGVLYAGLMLTASGPKVLEFNARFGDPETQVLMMQVDEDLLPLMEACAKGTLEPRPLKQFPGASVGVVLAAEGYPEAPKKGQRIEGLDEVASNAPVFLAGVAKQDGALVTAGGRVLTVCARGDSLATARERALESADAVRFEGKHFRRDIGARGLRARS
ncbi:phosphoribosylamine--glycine ligase [Corallococcus sp. AB004]|uniref:phosphoribosylamine--glycine ligase n=1 Tax=Corallococcus TaxID=83461 RepID=UPI000EA0A7F5|nr:phosphoribosylamine--glycine ligase [Corallococcus sp. AB038B]NPC68462.1 phosphoribosylamine--glycine ligase [Corallococcus exiguus]NPD21906.1 phosphoribosylamine--glycine ligase [Corallococcus exiguus]RKH93080.1 phosphoribosylamine--glycine ligase [Corallococcus sp. AB038B]RKI36492.1 phosphoribosylamine--glycine ligase [Corallococcus sp. AB004]